VKTVPLTAAASDVQLVLRRDHRDTGVIASISQLRPSPATDKVAASTAIGRLSEVTRTRRPALTARGCAGLPPRIRIGNDDRVDVKSLEHAAAARYRAGGRP